MEKIAVNDLTIAKRKKEAEQNQRVFEMKAKVELGLKSEEIEIQKMEDNERARVEYGSASEQLASELKAVEDAAAS
jgi:hypothetical protein